MAWFDPYLPEYEDALEKAENLSKTKELFCFKSKNEYPDNIVIDWVNYEKFKIYGEYFYYPKINSYYFQPETDGFGMLSYQQKDLPKSKKLEIYCFPEDFKSLGFKKDGKEYYPYTLKINKKKYFIEEKDREYLNTTFKTKLFDFPDETVYLDFNEIDSYCLYILKKKNLILEKKIKILEQNNENLEKDNENLRQTDKTRSEELDKIKKSRLYRFFKFLRLI